MPPEDTSDFEVVNLEDLSVEELEALIAEEQQKLLGGAGGGEEATTSAAAAANDLSMKDLEEELKRVEKERDALKQALEKNEGLSDLDSRTPSADTSVDAAGGSVGELERKVAQARSQCDAVFKGVDLCLMLDVTGSMEWCIEAAKTNLLSIIDIAPRQHPEAITRLAVVAYRDICDGPRQFEVHDFVTKDDLPGLEAVVKQLTAFGGGDGPENVAGALQEVLKLSWKSSTRLVVHFADYPAHGFKYTGPELAGLDDYPAGVPGLDPQALLQQLVCKRVDYHFARILHKTDHMVAAFREVYDQAGGAAEFFLHEFGERPDQFLPVMVNSVSSSMRRSFTSSSGGSASSSRAGGVPLLPVELPEVFGKLT